jgi:hypothetical protein
LDTLCISTLSTVIVWVMYGRENVRDSFSCKVGTCGSVTNTMDNKARRKGRSMQSMRWDEVEQKNLKSMRSMNSGRRLGLNK